MRALPTAPYVFRVKKVFVRVICKQYYEDGADLLATRSVFIKKYFIGCSNSISM